MMLDFLLRKVGLRCMFSSCFVLFLFPSRNVRDNISLCLVLLQCVVAIIQVTVPVLQ